MQVSVAIEINTSPNRSLSHTQRACHTHTVRTSSADTISAAVGERDPDTGGAKLTAVEAPVMGEVTLVTCTASSVTLTVGSLKSARKRTCWNTACFRPSNASKLSPVRRKTASTVRCPYVSA